MSYSLDVNLLLYASDRSSARHDDARKFLESCVEGPELLYVAWPTLMSYVRIATHPNIFAAPLSPGEAFGNVDALLAMSHVRPVSELDDFADAYKRVTEGLVVRGNLVPDAHLAAILFQHGVRMLYSSDRDFRKFATLDVRDPFSTTPT
jgi:toxin-antitoxin system PIN domain toxin